MINRLTGRLPKVGIRPVIDGRERGIRESLEEQTLNMAKAAAHLIEENLRFPGGEKVECVISETTIGGVVDAARCADQFEREGVSVSLTVTSCWCYGTEVMDSDPLIPKAIWGFNGTERHGAVYLASALAGYTQKGLPTFGIYGRDVQDSGAQSIPVEVKGEILRFVKAGLAVGLMKGKSYLSLGYTSMGIIGSTVNPDFFQDYLGMRTEFVDMIEILGRIKKEIYDKEEFKKAMVWVKKNCIEGMDPNKNPADRKRKDWEWEVNVKMTLIIRDLMIGNPKISKMGFGEEAKGHNALVGGFQGQRQWTDFYPTGDFTETILNSSFDWNGTREAFVFATENDSLNGVSMLFGHLLTNTSQIFSYVRTYWSPEAVKRVTGKKLTGLAENGIIHLINSVSTTLDATAQQRDKQGNTAMKPWWEITPAEVNKCLENTRWCPDERPISSLNSDIVLTSKTGFEDYLTALVLSARDELTSGDNYYRNINNTDVASSAGAEYAGTYAWNKIITPTTGYVSYFWNWAYLQMIPRANTIIVYANKPELKNIWATEAERNAVIAAARFFRGYAYNILANLYGGVPIIDTIYATSKFDFVRATRKEVYEFAKADLDFASEWLPATVVKTQEGRILKAAADHLLSEVCISLEEYDKAIASASLVINSGLYQLMTTRFGSEKDKPGDVFSDLFRDGNQNRSSGNLESIYVWQIEENTPGGGTIGNSNLRNWAPMLANIKDPNGVPQLLTDSMGRGVGRSRLSDLCVYEIWKDNWNNDMRNSPYNMRRVFYYNNPKSKFYLKVIEPKTVREDTMRNIYPYSRKVEGKALKGDITSGRTAKDVMVYRLAETCLLRAEAYMKNGDLQNAANDINVVRTRAHAKPVTPAEVTIDYILDERIRELLIEEPRRRTLIRTGKLVERVRKYDVLIESRTSIQDYHQFFPIPQEAIDANFGTKLEQNPGY